MDRVFTLFEAGEQIHAQSWPIGDSDHAIAHRGQLVHKFLVPTAVEAPRHFLLPDIVQSQRKMGGDGERDRPRAIMKSNGPRTRFG